MKYIISLLIVVVAILFYSLNVKDKEEAIFTQPLDIYICIGQSNMAGRGTLKKSLMDTLENTYILNETSMFEPAVNPMNKYLYY